MPYWHITLASEGRATLFPNETALRGAVGKLAKVVGRASLLFDIVDDHLHDLVEAPSREAANALCRRIILSLRSVSRVPFFGRDVRPVKTRSHLRSLVRYILTQTKHHGLKVHPALWTGSCFVDLAKARVLPGLKLRLREALPRLRWQHLLEMVDLPDDPLSPVNDDALLSLGLPRIAAAAAAATNAPPDLKGGSRSVLLARRCVASLARGCGIKSVEIERLLGWPVRSVGRYLSARPAKEALLAVRRRLALEELVAKADGSSCLQPNRWTVPAQ